MPVKTKRPHPAASPAAISGQVRAIIRERGLSAYGLARSAGVAPSVVSRFLSRERTLNLDTFDAIAGALGLRLVEGGRGRARPAAPRPAPEAGDPAEVPGAGPGPC